MVTVYVVLHPDLVLPKVPPIHYRILWLTARAILLLPPVVIDLATALGTLLLLPLCRQALRLLALASAPPLIRLTLVMLLLPLPMLLSSVFTRLLLVHSCLSSSLF